MAQNLADAVKRGSSSQLERGLQLHGAAINGLTASDQTALHLAVWHGNHNIIQQLLDAGADVSKRDGESGWTPLHKALYQGSFVAAALLLRAGGPTDATDPKGRAPVDLLSQELQPFLLAAAASSSSPEQQAVRQQVCRSTAAVELPPGSSRSQLFSWGNGANFQLGTGSTDFHLLPVRVDFSAVHSATPPADTATASSSTDAAATLATTGGGSSSSSSSAGGARLLSQQQPASPERLVAVAAAKFHSCAVSDAGQVYTWGFGRGGRLGHPEFEVHSGSSAVILPRLVTGLGRRKVVCVSAAKHHTLVATSAGEVFSWGSNKDGRLGYPAVDNQAHPRKVALLRVRATCVAAANKHSVVVTSGGEVYTWGGNAMGQLGYGTSDCTSNPTPRLVEAMKGRRLVTVAAAKRHTVVLTAEGEVYNWGHKLVTPRKVSLTGSRDTARAGAGPGGGGMAGGSTSSEVPSPAVTSSSTGASGSGPAGAAASSSYSGVGAAAGLEVRFHQGQSEVLRPVAIAVAAGAAHTTCLTRTGVVLTWRSEQLQPVVQEVLGPLAGQRAVAVSAGKTRTAVVTAAGDVYCWEGSPASNDQLQQPQALLSPVPAGTAGASSGGSGAAGSSSGGSGRGPSGADSRPLPQKSAGDVDASGMSTSAAGGAAGGAGVAAVVPVQVPGVKKVAQLAVGEKHSLAIQALWCPMLPEDSDQHSSMILAPHHSSHASAAVSSTAAGHSSRGAGGWQAGERPPQGLSAAAGSSASLEYTAAADAVAAGTGSSSDSDPDAAPSSRVRRPPSAQQEQKADAQELWPHGASSSGPWGPQEEAAHNTDDAGASSLVESLQLMCQRAVSRQLVDPRTALPILEYAAVAGAELLRSYCLAVAVGNLDVVLQEARHSFEGLSQQLLVELEKVYAALVLSHSSSSRSSSSSGAGGRVMQWQERAPPQQQQQQQQQQHFYSHLQPGKRPTACPSAEDAAARIAEGTAGTAGGSTRSALSVAVQALDAVQQLPDHLLPLPRPPTFRSHPDATQDELQQEAAAKLTRTCVKKLQQIDSLEQRQAAGDVLDEQQRAKLSLKSAWQHALRRLEAGWPAAEVADVMAKAQEAAGLSSAGTTGLPTPAVAAAAAAVAGARPAAGADHSASGDAAPVARRAPQAGAQGGGTDPAHVVLGAAGAAAAAVSPEEAEPAASSTTPSSGGRKAARQASKRVGGLSMFLKGALDSPPPAPSPAPPAAGPSSSSSKEPGVPKAPAWGGVRPHVPAVAPAEGSALKQLLGGSPGAATTSTSSNSSNSRVAGSSGANPTSAAAGAPSALPPTPVAAAAGSSGWPTGSAAHLPSAATKGGPTTGTTSSSTPPVARQLSHSSGLLGSSPGSGSSGWLGGAAAPVYGSSPPMGGAGRTPGRSSASGTASSSRPASGARPDSSSGGDASSGPQQVTLFDLLLQQRKAAKAAAVPRAAESSKGEPAPPAWGGVGIATAAAGSTASGTAASASAAGGGDRVLGTSPGGLLTPAVKSLKEIQAEQEQVRATAGLAALQRERAAAAAAGGKPPGGSSPLPQPGVRQGAGAPTAAATTTTSSSSASAAAGVSLQVQQLRAAGGLTAALAASPGLLGRSPSNSAAVLGSSPNSLGRGGSSSWRLAGGSGAFSSSRPGGGGAGGTSSSSYVMGSSPSAPSKWYTGDLPQVRPLTSIQLEQQEAALQQQLAAAREEEERIANELIAAAEAKERAAAKAAARKAARAAARQAARAAADDAVPGAAAAEGVQGTSAPAEAAAAAAAVAAAIRGGGRGGDRDDTDAATSSREAGVGDRGHGPSRHRRHGRGGSSQGGRGPRPDSTTPAAAGEAAAGVVDGAAAGAAPSSGAGGAAAGRRGRGRGPGKGSGREGHGSYSGGGSRGRGLAGRSSPGGRRSPRDGQQQQPAAQQPAPAATQ